MFYQQFCREEFDDQGRLVRFDLEYPENYNFGYDVVDRIAEVTPEKLALLWIDAEKNERRFTFDQIRRLSNQTVHALRSRGVKRGDRVMLMMKRCYAYWFVVVALHKIGAIAVPVSHMLRLEDVVYRVHKIGISYVISLADDGIAGILQEVKEELSGLKEIWTYGPNKCGLRNLEEDIAYMPETLERMPTSVSDIMIVYFTSGTTDYPKAVAHNHTYSLAHILTAKYWQRVEENGLHMTVADTGWGKASWGKIYGQWLMGAVVIVYDFESFDSRQLVTILNRYKVNTFCAPPTVYRYMVKRGNIELPWLHHAVSAGEFLSPEISAKFEEQTGLAIAEGFGQTETTLQIANIAGYETRRGSMGRPTPLYDIEVVKEDGTPVSPGEPGEIVIRLRENQSGLMMGYLNEQTVTSKSFSDGVYHTGDLAWVDPDGYFWYNGRKDDVIKSGGFRVGPVEIENIVIEHPLVLECSVVGVPDALRGQAIKAVIVLLPKAVPSDELKKEIRQFANARLAVFKHIRHIEFVDELPKTHNGKIRKRVFG
ncbi:MAG: AMP-binding protein [Thermoguttaceae bacterium]|nr:AMP-binding protein [Thermoguttaceae bacterium]